jgi:hypothetical protein
MTASRHRRLAWTGGHPPRRAQVSMRVGNTRYFGMSARWVRTRAGEGRWGGRCLRYR